MSFSRGSRLATPRRWKRTEKSDYNSSRRSFVRWFPTPRKWTLQGLQKSGKLHVRVRDLILPATGDAGPVTAVSASLVCGGSGGTVQSETAPVALSMKGNASLHGHIALPSLCFAPIVLVHIAAANGNPIPQPGPWIAATGG